MISVVMLVDLVFNWPKQNSFLIRGFESLCSVTLLKFLEKIKFLPTKKLMIRKYKSKEIVVTHILVLHLYIIKDVTVDTCLQVVLRIKLSEQQKMLMMYNRLKLIKIGNKDIEIE